VLLVIGQLHRGGAEGQLVQLALGLPRRRYEPLVACLSSVAEPHGSSLRGAGVRVEVLERKGHADLGRVLALARLVRSSGAAVVHSFLVGANVYAYAATRLGGRPPFVASSRTSMEIPGAASRRIHSWVFRHADYVIANSESVAGFTRSYYGVDPRRLRVVPNGVREAGEIAGREEARRELGGDGSSLIVGTLGRLSAEKNIPLLLRAAGIVSRRFPAARFAVGGDGPERGFLAGEIRRLGLEDRVVLAGDRSDVPRFLSALDLFVLTSDTEGLPNAVMEAMGLGLPVVATRVGGTHEVVDDGVTGRLVAPRDAEGLARAIGDLLADPEARRRLGAAGRARISEEYTTERMIERTCAVYDEARERAR